MYTAKIQKWGNSQGLRLPKYILDKVNISEGDTVEVTLEDNKIIIFQPKMVLKKYTINNLFKNYKGDFKPEEHDWGESVGKEEW